MNVINSSSNNNHHHHHHQQQPSLSSSSSKLSSSDPIDRVGVGVGETEKGNDESEENNQSSKQTSSSILNNNIKSNRTSIKKSPTNRSTSLQLPNSSNRQRSQSSSDLPPPFPSPSGTFLPPPVIGGDWKLPVSLDQFKRLKSTGFENGTGNVPPSRSFNDLAEEIESLEKDSIMMTTNGRSNGRRETKDSRLLNRSNGIVDQEGLGLSPPSQSSSTAAADYLNHRRSQPPMINGGGGWMTTSRGGSNNVLTKGVYQLKRRSAPHMIPGSKRPSRPASNSNEALLSASQSQLAIRLLKRLSSPNRSPSPTVLRQPSKSSSPSSSSRRSSNNPEQTLSSSNNHQSSAQTNDGVENTTEPPSISSSKANDQTSQDASGQATDREKAIEGSPIKIRDFGFRIADPRHVGTRAVEENRFSNGKDEPYQNQRSNPLSSSSSSIWNINSTEEDDDDYYNDDDDDDLERRITVEPASSLDEEEGGDLIGNENFGDGGGGLAIQGGSAVGEGELYVALYDFKAEGESEMDLIEGEFVKVLEVICDGWVVAQKVKGEIVEEEEEVSDDGDENEGVEGEEEEGEEEEEADDGKKDDQENDKDKGSEEEKEGDEGGKDVTLKRKKKKKRKKLTRTSKFIEDFEFEGVTGLCPENYLLKV